jgi:hypothetical protein
LDEPGEPLCPTLDPKSESEYPIDFEDSLELQLSTPRSRQMSEATVMLAEIERGDPKAAEQFFVLVYDGVLSQAVTGPSTPIRYER